MGKLLILGSGPAGVSAALYAARAGAEVTMVSQGPGALAKAHLIENYYGLETPLSGEALHERGIAQARALGVNVVEDQVFSIEFDPSSAEGAWAFVCAENTYRGDAAVLAAGSVRKTPAIAGVKDFEGRGVSYCAVCDGFFHRGKEVAVLGDGPYAVHEASHLAAFAAGVTILTDGHDAPSDVPEGIRVSTSEIKGLTGDQLLSAVEFADGSTLEISGFFVAQGTAGSSDLAMKLGVMTENGKIVTDDKCATNIPGFFAAGDCTGGMLQVAKAVYEGAVAGSEAAKYIRNLKK